MRDEGAELLRLLGNAHASLAEAELWAAQHGEKEFKFDIDRADARVRGIIHDIERLRDNR